MTTLVKGVSNDCSNHHKYYFKDITNFDMNFHEVTKLKVSLLIMHWELSVLPTHGESRPATLWKVDIV